MTNHPNHSSTNQLLADLDHASVTLSAPDARRVMRDMAAKVRVTVQRDKRRIALEKALAAKEGDMSNQGCAQYADIARQLADVASVDLPGVLAQARVALAEWDGF